MNTLTLNPKPTPRFGKNNTTNLKKDTRNTRSIQLPVQIRIIQSYTILFVRPFTLVEPNQNLEGDPST